MLLALLLTMLAQNPATMAGGAGGAILIPAPHITLFSSNPGTECSGSAVTTDQGGSLTFTRALAAYCRRAADGVYVAVSSNQPRVSNNGLLIEGARTNLVIRNTALDNAAWTATNTTVTANLGLDPTGALTAENLSSTSSGGFLASTAFVPGNTTMTVSMWVADAADSGDFDVVVRDTSAGADKTTCDYDPTLYQSLTRITCASTGLTSANNHVIRIYPGGTGGVGEFYVWGVQAEGPLSTLATSNIDTAAASVNRPNDVATFANSIDISTRGCLKATVTFPTTGINTSGATILGNGTERMLGYTSATAMSVNDGTNTVTANVSDVQGRTIDILTKWSGATMTIIADGVTASGSFDGSFSSTATMRIGSLSAGSYSYAEIKNIKVGQHPESCN